MANLASLLDRSAARHPDRPAVIFEDRSFTYRDVLTAANQVAHRLASAGIGPGDTVALSCPNVPQFTADE